MSNSESIIQFGNNAWKTCNRIFLREVIMGRELFDYAFKVYQTVGNSNILLQDFFRTMEDASAVDLDWFFRGGFILLILWISV
jgi:hypothetical protein